MSHNFQDCFTIYILVEWSRLIFSNVSMQTIFLDFNGTISSSIFWEHILDKPQHTYNQEINKIADRIFSDTDLVNNWMRGKHSAEEIVQYVCKDLQFSADLADKAINELEVSCRNMELDDRLLFELLEDLRNKGHKLFIATNNMDTFNRWTIESLRLHQYFDGILNSYSLHAMKHDLDNNGRSKFFSEIVEKHELASEDCLFFDDGKDKFDVISGLGMRYIRVTDSSKLSELIKEYL